MSEARRMRPYGARGWDDRKAAPCRERREARAACAVPPPEHPLTCDCWDCKSEQAPFFAYPDALWERA